MKLIVSSQLSRLLVIITGEWALFVCCLWGFCCIFFLPDPPRGGRSGKSLHNFFVGAEWAQTRTSTIWHDSENELVLTYFLTAVFMQHKKIHLFLYLVLLTKNHSVTPYSMCILTKEICDLTVAFLNFGPFSLVCKCSLQFWNWF